MGSGCEPGTKPTGASRPWNSVTHRFLGSSSGKMPKKSVYWVGWWLGLVLEWTSSAWLEGRRG